LNHQAKVGTVKLDIQRLDINDIAQQVVDTMKFSARKANAAIELETLPDCLGDEVQINQVFSNLIGNAVKYLDPDRPGRIRIWGKVEGNLSQYCVEDNGVDIPDYHKPKVFEIFHRVDPKGSASGDGLGLTTSKQIVERHKGYIWLESEPGKGSKFFVSLPTVKA
jgi:signal transduction histidine kinase